MNTKLLAIALLIFLIGCDCKPDKYGEILELVVPVTTSPAKDTFAIGDTLLVEAIFDKEVEIYNTSNSIRLDSFMFFPFFGISEISDTIENYYVDIDTIVQIGNVGYLPLHNNVLAYPLTLFEDSESYQISFKVVLHSAGMFWINISSASFIYDETNYDHPALYVCDNNRRDRVEVYYNNSSTTREAFDNIFLKTKVDYLHQLVDYDRYAKAGSISIIVE